MRISDWSSDVCSSDHFDNSTPEMAPPARIAEIDDQAEHAPPRQEQHCRQREIEEQEYATDDRRWRDHPYQRHLEVTWTLRVLHPQDHHRHRPHEDSI